MKEQSDEALMEMVQEGSQEALSELYSRHSGKVWSYLIKRVPKESVDDLFQDCFVKIVEKKNLWHGQPFVLWLYVVLKNLLIDHLRQAQVERRVLNKVEIEVSPSEEDFNELISDVPSDTSTLLRDYFKDGLSYKELAEKYAASEMSLRKRMSRAIANLRKGF